MNDTRFENQVEQLARQFRYPPTPRLQALPPGSSAVRRFAPPRRWAPLALALLLAAVLLGSLALIPSVRAQVLEFLDIGAIRIFFTTSTPTPTGSPDPAEPTEAGQPLQLPGLTSLEAAQEAAGFRLRLPDHPLVSGEPDQVNLLETPAPVVFLTWYDPDDPQQVLARLTIIGPNGPVTKPIGDTIFPTRVNGGEAFWVINPHPFQLWDMQGEMLVQYLVEKPVLLWFAGPLTYRLEADVSMEEAVQIAESLQ